MKMKIQRKEWSNAKRWYRLGHRSIWVMAAGVVALATSLASVAKPPAVMMPLSARKPAPSFNLTDESGAPIRLTDYKGRVVVLDFWATWCHGCKLEIPWFMEFEEKYKAKGLSVIGVSMDADGWKSVRPFIAEKKMNYTVVIGNDGLAKQYGLSAMPMTVLIDREGRVADKHSGVVDKAKWESKIRTLLREDGEQTSH
jgi:peroxiredoxin